MKKKLLRNTNPSEEGFFEKNKEMIACLAAFTGGLIIGRLMGPPQFHVEVYPKLSLFSGKEEEK